MTSLACAETVAPDRIGPTRWTELPNGARSVGVNVTAVWLGAEEGSETLGALYRKGTRNQWSVDDIDWSGELDPANPLQMPDFSIPLALTPIWPKMSEAERSTVRQRLQCWHLSQILQSERSGMLCVSKVMLASDDMEEKNCAAIQAVDEARHAQAFGRLLAKVGPEVPISPSLDRLLHNIIEDTEPGIVALGMQVMLEGFALAFFKSLAAYSKTPLVRQVTELVIRDEARHFASGQLSLAKLHAQLSHAELLRREDYVVETCDLLNNYVFADELWEPLGLNKKECMELTRSSSVNRAMHRSLFRSIVPAVRSVGLLGQRARRAFEQMGVLDYAAFPSAELARA